VGADEEVLRFIADEFGWSTDDELTIDTPLLEVGAIDSLGMYQLATWIEDRYRVEIDADEFTAAHFATVRTIAALLDAKLST
jgi:acyl carrier protein